MAFSVNKITLLGNLARDVELKYTPSGKAVAVMTVCTNRGVKKGDQWEEVASFHRVTAWGKIAEFVGKSLSKGDKVYCDGRIDYHDYEKNGVKVYVTDIIAENVIPMNKKESTPRQTQEEAPEQETAPEQPENTGKEDVNPNDIPF